MSPLPPLHFATRRGKCIQSAEFDILSSRLTPQVWDESLVRGYFSGQDYVWAPNGCLPAFTINFLHTYSRPGTLRFYLNDNGASRGLIASSLENAIINHVEGRQTVFGINSTHDYIIFSNSTTLASITRDLFVSRRVITVVSELRRALKLRLATVPGIAVRCYGIWSVVARHRSLLL